MKKYLVIALSLFIAVAAHAQISGAGQFGCGAAPITGTGWTSATSVNTTQILATNISSAQVLVTLDQGTTLTAGAISFLGDPGDGNFVTLAAWQVVDPTSATQTTISIPYSLVASTNKQFMLQTSGYYRIEMKLTTAITGSGTITPYTTPFCNVSTTVVQAANANLNASVTFPSAQSVSQSGTWTVQPGNTQNTTPWLATPVAESTSTYALTSFEADAVTTATTVKSSAGNFYGYLVTNTNTSTCYLQVFNTTSPTLGTTAPILSIGIPASSTAGGAANFFMQIPVNFSTAIAVAATTASKGASTCGTGMTVNIFYQ